MALACLVSLVFWVHPWYDPTNDGSMYIATARSLAAGEGYSYLGEPFRIRPPGFSLLLAPLFAFFGTNFTLLNLVVSLFGVLLVTALYFFCVPRIGWFLAVLVALCVWANPGFQRLCNQVMSDVPGTALVLVSLLVERRMRSRDVFRDGGWRCQLLFGLGLGVVVHLRSSAFLLLPALLVARLARRLALLRENGDPQRWGSWLLGNGLLVVGTLSLVVPWNVRNELVAPEPPADQTRLYDYSTGMWHEDMGDPGSRRLEWSEIGARFHERKLQIAASLGNRLIKTGQRGARANAWAIFFIACSAIVLVRRREAAELFVFATLVVVAFYFGYSPRLMLPCYVLGLAAAAEVLRGLLGLVVRPGIAEHVVGVLLLGLFATDLQPRRGWKAIQEKHETFEAVAEEIERRAPDGVLGAYRAWDLSVYLGRPVYGFEQVQRRVGRPGACEAVLDKYGGPKQAPLLCLIKNGTFVNGRTTMERAKEVAVRNEKRKYDKIIEWLEKGLPAQ